MGRIELSMESFASEADMETAIEQASAALPAGMSATKASQTRDANGKLVSVTIGIPGNANAAERTAARNAIVSANPGVAQAISYPIGGEVDDLDSLTPGATVAAANVTTVVPLSGLSTIIFPIQGTVVGAQAADSVGGTGSAHEIKDANTATVATSHNMETLYRMIASENGVSSIGGFRMAASLQMIDKGFRGDTKEQVRVQIGGGAGVERFALIYDPVLLGVATWHLINFDDASVKVDMNVGLFDRFDFEFELSPAGIMKITVGINSFSKDLGFAPSSSIVALSCNVNDTFAVAASGTQKSMILDNIDFAILS